MPMMPIMTFTRAFAVVVPVISLCVAACGSSNSSDSAGNAGATDASNESDASSCDAIQSEARDAVSRAIEANQRCTATADCVEVSFATSCFDSCSRGIAKAGAPEVEAAKADAEKNACARFKAKGCKSTIPPCEPPTLRCVSGKCET